MSIATWSKQSIGRAVHSLYTLSWKSTWHHVPRCLECQKKLLCIIFMQGAPGRQQPSKVSKKRSSLKPCCTFSESSAAACGTLQIALVFYCVVEHNAQAAYLLETCLKHSECKLVVPQLCSRCGSSASNLAEMQTYTQCTRNSWQTLFTLRPPGCAPLRLGSPAAGWGATSGGPQDLTEPCCASHAVCCTRTNSTGCSDQPCPAGTQSGSSAALTAYIGFSCSSERRAM